MLSLLKKVLELILPRALFQKIREGYHYALAWGAALYYGFPGNALTVIGVTGTKGKSSTVEMVNAIFEEAGYTTAVISTIRFKTGAVSQPNMFKMTMPGRGYVQKLLAEARRHDATHAIIEITSEGARQFRHLGIPLDALIFTNIAPEHIESHGSYENYKKAKLSIGAALVSSSKRPRTVVANPNDELGQEFLKLPVENRVSFSLPDAALFTLSENGVEFPLGHERVRMKFPGTFTILNALAAAGIARSFGIHDAVSAEGLRNMRTIPGRTECIERGQEFLAVVDYAHTPESLRALYEAYGTRRKICVLGNTGGGRDTWKRPEMGAIADQACEMVILTNEDPYDEDPKKIVDEMARGMARAPRIIMDRREAIQAALTAAQPNDVVLITGKGTDPYIMEAGGEKTVWSDARVVREELEKLGYKDSVE